ncbi:DegT/DnrJ/EryC1/StrS family aminotransferase [Candidatus Pelagibacter sp.]|nr:DegT/DnrJ/EryC1/StrS family aminotransferase [Candidatus Pelagibacter sp.]
MVKTNKTFNFYNGRSALDFGIKSLSLKENSKIFLPEIICDVAVKVFLKNKLDIIYYKLDESFQPVWTELNKINNKNIKGILMVHYFGFPQNFNKFKKFAKKRNIFLIEDNCHSLDVSYKKEVLGMIGDIGIDSPRKILNNLYSGGRLYINKNLKFKKVNISKYKPSYFEIFKKKIKNNIPKLIKKIRFLGYRPQYESPFLFSNIDNSFKNKKIDNFSINYLNKFNKEKESLRRVRLFNKIQTFARNNEIKTVFKIQKNLIPMHFVGMAKSKSHASQIFDWGWKNKIEILSWPSFDINKKLNNKLVNRWQKYICIPLNEDIKYINEKKI